MRSDGQDKEPIHVKRTPLTRSALAAAAAGLALTLTACGSDEPADTSASSSTSSSASETAATTQAAGTGQPFGPGCAAVPADGEGSFTGMADDPVGTAATNNPALSTLVQAVTAANLVDTLNTTDNITVLAPANPAFEAIPPDTLNAMLADTAQLTAILTHHVIPGRLTPEQLAGSHTTLNNDEVVIEGSGESFTIAGEGTATKTPAAVICGNVQTANATVYIIDQVLAPPAA
jgi:uncharacterized surface protein with fasciclin (FAS1) repeats